MSERDYVLGTQDQEIDRLGLQHRVWRARTLEAWRRARIGEGNTVLDVGAGPGFASFDLAEIVGPRGKVIALERSRRFLDHVEARGLANIETREQDVEMGFGESVAEAAWCRWLLSFVSDPRRVVANIARALKPGGRAVFHEYVDYGAWQMMPRNADIDRFRTLVMQSWREAGGEPDIGLTLPLWLEQAGLEIIEVRPHIEIVRRDDFTWTWPAAFIASNSRRLHELGYVDAEEARRLSRALDEATDSAWMITPLVVEIIARRPK
jgi:SAM-dependent methyltransferase